MGNNRSSGPNGASFPGVVADGNDEIEFNILKLIDGLAASVGGIDLKVIPQDCEGHWMRGALWLYAPAEDVKSPFALLPEEVLGDNAACGISGTQEKDFETGFMHVNRFALNLDAVRAVLPCPAGGQTPA